MGKRTDDMDAFMKELEVEAAANGRIGEFRAWRDHFRLARQVIELRLAKRWTQQQLARASGVQQSEISRIERAQGNPTVRTLQALARCGRMRVALVPARPTRLPRRPLRKRARRV